MSWDNSYRTIRRWRLAGVLTLGSLLGVTGLWMATHSEFSNENKATAVKAGPPWILGRSDSRFRIVEFADLECPYCRKYFMTLQSLVRTHPEVSVEWRHFPLSIHEPRATQAARVVECVGETGGNEAFWEAVARMYREEPPSLSSGVKKCLSSRRPDLIIAAQSAAGRKAKIEATPTVQLIDRKSGRSLSLQGSLEADALLSAMDWLAAPEFTQGNGA